MKRSFTLALSLLFFACTRLPEAPSITSLTRPADFTLTPQLHPHPWAGFGACMNPYLYAYPNTREISEAQVKDLEQKILDLKPQHVRLFLHLSWWHPETGGDRFVSKGKDPHVRESFIRTARLAQRAGAAINVTLWFGPWTDPEAQATEFAAILDGLIRREKLTAIRYVTIQNEVNSVEDKVPKPVYSRLYKTFDAEMRKRNLRDHIQIVGGDLVYLHQDEWFAYLANDLHDVCDAWSAHVYWDYTDTPKLTRRLNDIRRDIDALPAEKRKPLQLTEFGVRGYRAQPSLEPGTYTKSGPPITETVTGAMQANWFVLESINRGFTATVQWDLYDAWYDRKMRYGLLGDVHESFRPKPGYHALKLFTHTTPVGSRAVVLTGSHPHATAAVFRTPAGGTTIYTLNHTDHPTQLTLAGLPASATFSLQTWNATGFGHLTNSLDPLRPQPDGTLRVRLNPMSMAALVSTR